MIWPRHTSNIISAAPASEQQAPCREGAPGHPLPDQHQRHSRRPLQRRTARRRCACAPSARPWAAGPPRRDGQVLAEAAWMRCPRHWRPCPSDAALNAGAAALIHWRPPACRHRRACYRRWLGSRGPLSSTNANGDPERRPDRCCRCSSAAGRAPPPPRTACAGPCCASTCSLECSI